MMDCLEHVYIRQFASHLSICLYMYRIGRRRAETAAQQLVRRSLTAMPNVERWSILYVSVRL